MNCLRMQGILPVLLQLCTFTLGSSATSTVWYSEFVVVRGQAELPCLVPDPPSQTDRPLLVLWYKQDQSQVPIYSYDSRNGPFKDGHRWADETYLGERAFFRINSDPPTLVIKEVKVSDQDLYTCRVEFKFRPNAITKVNLTVIVPAGPPLILDSAGREVRGSVGPLEEGQRAHLTCRSVGGTPEPTLSWWRDGRRLKQSSGLGSGEVIESRISLLVTRQLHDATLSCQALNNNITEPSTTSLSVNVLLRPVSLELVQAERQLSAGEETELVCAARGSRPAARITWWRGDVEIPDVQHTVMNNGNLTTGSVKFVPQMSDDGQTFSCRAVNPEIHHTPLEESTTLTVLYAPRVNLSLGKPLRADDIKEGDDVYFECSVLANPGVQHISWYHNAERPS
ncbi:nephrin [Hyalella azteca]|uniref:Nephrin n=1 Tax=Hyalella azteca TaxID=294128 RepID=A0A979FY83_HYAAZ|nr:nephrin [Hyalella azteca]